MAEKTYHSMVPLLQAAERSSLEGFPAAIGAFNVNFYSQAAGILEGLRRADAPAIIQASKGACDFQGGADRIAAMVRRAMDESKHRLPVCLHLDHGNPESSGKCLEGGFSSVMVDTSDQPLFDNIKAVRSIVDLASRQGVSVEGEYGALAGVEEDIRHEHTTYANPLLVPFILDESGADALAIAYGTSHGPNKGANISALKLSIVRESYEGLKAYRLNERKFLVGHGSSTVPGELVREINAHGGAIADAHGVPMRAIRKGIAFGLRKINIDTDLRLAITAEFRKYLEEKPDMAERFPHTLGRIAGAFGGRIPMMAKGKPQDPKKVIDPRGYLGVIDVHVLREPPTEESGLQEVMGRVRERLAAHVEMLVNEFGSAGLARDVKGAPAA